MSARNSENPFIAQSDVDPVRRRRAAISKWTRRANRLGYLFFAAAMILFVVALGTTFNGAMAALITATLVLGSVLLAPAIVLGYAVKAAEKEDPGTTTPT